MPSKGTYRCRECEFEIELVFDTQIAAPVHDLPHLMEMQLPLSRKALVMRCPNTRMDRVS